MMPAETSRDMLSAMQEMVIFRDDLQNRMRKLCLLAPNGEPVSLEPFLVQYVSTCLASMQAAGPPAWLCEAASCRLRI